MDALSADEREHPTSRAEREAAGRANGKAPGGNGATQEWLRAVAEEARAAFPRWRQAPELVLIDVDPRHVHAFWTVPAAAVDVARRALGDAGADAPMVLRLHEALQDGMNPETIDVEVVGLHGYCYVDIWGECRRYVGELGLLRGDRSLLPLISGAQVVLPAIGPNTERAPAGERSNGDARPQPQQQRPQPEGQPGPSQPDRRVLAAELPEPVRHPLPLPPAEGSTYDPLAGMGAPFPTFPPSPTTAPSTGAPPAAPLAPDGAPAPAPGVPHAPPPGARVANGSAADLPEPVRHPFPLPPAESSDFDPFALVGGFISPAAPEPAQAWPPEDAAAALPPHAAGDSAPLFLSAAPETAAPEIAAPEPGTPQTDVPQAGAAHAGDASGGPGDDALPLETVLALSSYALGQEFGEEHVSFEVNAELRVFGRARPGSRLQLFGKPVRLRPDGTFSVTRPLPRGALILTSLLTESSDEPSA